MLHGTPRVWPEETWPILKRIEPSVVELTKEEYEKGLGIKSEGGEGAAPNYGRTGLVEDQAIKAEAQVPRAEAIKTLRERGFEYKTLRSKTKSELNDML